jgi:glycerol-3-phosphate acyltransferase PlsY
MDIATTILLLLGSYFVGSLPFGLWVGKLLKGKDIRTMGSGNIGATNVWRCLGPVAGTAVLVLDVAKGLLPALVGMSLSGEPLAVAAGLASVIGHSASPFLGFKGGKGVATTLGMLFGVAPVAAGYTVLVWSVALLITRYVSLASIVASFFATAYVLLADHSLAVRAVIVLAAVLIILRHRPNISRLLDGTEPKFPSRPPGAESDDPDLSLHSRTVKGNASDEPPSLHSHTVKGNASDEPPSLHSRTVKGNADVLGSSPAATEQAPTTPDPNTRTATPNGCI